MQTAISSLSINGEFSEKLAAAAAAGFSAIEIVEEDFLAHGGTPAEIGRMIQDHGLKVALLASAIAFEGLPGSLRQKAFDRIDRRFDMMAGLGTRLMLIASSTHPASLGGVDRMASDFADLGAKAAARGLLIGYEPQAWGHHVSDHRDAWEILRRAAHPAVGLVLDSFHVLARGRSPESIRSIPGDRIFHVQLADAAQVEMDLELKSRHFRSLPGEDELPLPAFLSAVAVTGYDGVISIDTPNNRSRGSARAIARDARRALEQLADQVGRAEPSAWLDRTAIPPKAHVNGVEFVEFTTSPEEAVAFGKLLRLLGFARVARHVAKDVTLWRQAGIKIVVNTERKGFAHSAYVMHGTSVCDIGLIVDDAAATALRALAFGATDFTQARERGELAIPAVRGVGGSVLHFLDQGSELATVWETEFRTEAEDLQAHPVGLNRVDHIAQVMRQDELPTWTQFYSAMFDVEKAAEVSVSDPGGKVQSRALQSRDGSVRFTLNGVDGHHTFAGRFMSDSYGSSVQHLAFTTDDLLRTASQLTANGFEFLPVPASYYSEIATDFDLSADLIEQLQQANAFYDEDGSGGIYLQLYSRPVGDGFFFEIVERRGGYDGYGARNAGWRTAALKGCIERNTVLSSSPSRRDFTCADRRPEHWRGLGPPASHQK